MVATSNAATCMGKNFSTIQNFNMNSEDLTLKQMFDIIAKLVSDQDEIRGLDKIHWGKNSWRQLSLFEDETVINLQSTKVYVFPDSVWCLGRVLQHPGSNEAWKNRIAGVKAEKSYRDYDGINGESIEFELSELGQTPETFTGSILFMSMFNDISLLRSSPNLQRNLVLRNGHLLDQVHSPQGAWDHIAEDMLLEFAESGHPIFRATTPLSRGQLKSKGHGKLSIHFTAHHPTIETFCR